MTAKQSEDYFQNIDEATQEKKSYRDSLIFEYKGNNYSYDKCVDYCDEFLRSYQKHKSKKFYYMDALQQLMQNQSITLVVDYMDICDSHIKDEDMYHSDFLHHLLEQNPKLFLKAMRRAAHDILKELHLDYAMEIINQFKVNVSNAQMFRKEITDINHDDVGHVIYTEDFVISSSEQKDYTKRMSWLCGACGKYTYKDSIGFKLAKCKRCDYCDSDDIWESNANAITDTMQEIKIQQRFERVESGQVPKVITGIIFGKDMMNLARAGDICAITGIVDIMRYPTQAENAISDYYLEIQWMERIPDDFLIEDDPELEERVKKFIDQKDEDKGYQSLINSIAPSVMGHEVIKEALLLQLVGSDTAYFEDNSRHRGESNILLVGDAGTAKTKLGYYVYQLYARAVYVAGKVTEAGMTAAVDVAHKSGHQVLQAGAYLLASSDSGGLVVADEMEKTEIKAKDATAACLDDRQMVEIHKGNIHQSIQINVASLHIANPKTGESWNSELSVKENTGFENWYLSRFCTWIVRDEVDKELDEKKAKHYLKQFGNTVRQYELKDISLNELRRKQALLTPYTAHDIKTVPEMRMYHKYVRKHFHPRLDPESKVAEKLWRFYMSVRPMTGNTKGLRITMRAMGDLVRFTEESARAHFRNHCTLKDADIAIKLVSSSIASSGFNMFTGKYEQIGGEEDEDKKKKKKGMSLGENTGGFFTAQELLENKTAREFISQNIEQIAKKRQNRFFREVSLKMKKVVRLVKLMALLKCRDCAGDGYIQEGQLRNICYSCQGHGGFTQTFDLNELNYQLQNAGLTGKDIEELTTHLIKKKIIHPLFNNTNSYALSKNDYKAALLELKAIETQIELIMESEHENSMYNKDNKNLLKDPSMQEKISKIKNLMPDDVRENIRKKLNQQFDDDDDDDEEYDDEE